MGSNLPYNEQNAFKDNRDTSYMLGYIDGKSHYLGAIHGMDNHESVYDTWDVEAYRMGHADALGEFELNEELFVELLESG